DHRGGAAEQHADLAPLHTGRGGPGAVRVGRRRQRAAPVVPVVVAGLAVIDRISLGEGEVIVRVDEAGRDDRAGAVDPGGAGRIGGVGAAAADAGDLVSLVEDAAVLEDHAAAEHGAAQQH